MRAYIYICIYIYIYNLTTTASVQTHTHTHTHTKQADLGSAVYTPSVFFHIVTRPADMTFAKIVAE